MENDKAIVLVCWNNGQVDQLFEKLNRIKFDTGSISIVGKQSYFDGKNYWYFNQHEGMIKSGEAGVFWEGIWRHLSGSAFFYIPGIGSLLIAGPFASTLHAALEAPLVYLGQSALGAALVKEGILWQETYSYEMDVRDGKYLLLIHGDEKSLAVAKDVLYMHYQD